MNNIQFIEKITIVLGLVLTIQVGAANAGTTLYYDTKLSMKLVQEDITGPSSSKIFTETRTQKPLINIVQNLPDNTRVDKNTILALRIDDCSTGAAQLVVFNKLAKSEIKSVSGTFTLFNNKVQKTKNGVISEARFYTTAEFLDSGSTEDYAMNSGELNIVGSAKFSANGCPTSLSASFIGFIYVNFLDFDGSFPVTNKQMLIANGSTLTASLLK